MEDAGLVPARTEPVDHALEEVPENEANILPYPVVGIGASAGGIEAYIDILENLPLDTGMTFVLVPHQSPDHKSHLTQILQSHTRLPISVIEDGIRPGPNQIYVAPPNYFVRITNGLLQLESREEKQKTSLAIDYFFRSLAIDQKTMAVGVVLSGMDSDGASGLKAIKGEGGIALVQEPTTARYPDMPLSSIAIDHVDLVVPPAQIAAELARLAILYAKPDLQPLRNGRAVVSERDTFQKIFRLLRALCGLDFSLYKPGTVRRRIARRMLVTQSDNIHEYLKVLQHRPEEQRLLQEDLLVGLTWLFRDPPLFEALQQKVFPELFRGRGPQQQVRFWVAGCSTGEEVYSLVISLLEYTTVNRLEPQIQVFGTDASDRAIDKARLGLFPESVAKEISPERLARFFVRVDHGYQLSKRVRDLCVFAHQNLCADPPFSRIDLVSCRNVLIYLGPQLQKRVIPTFHYSLNPGGFLLLGQSEALREFTQIFDPYDRASKVYRKVDGPKIELELPRYISPPRISPTRALTQGSSAFSVRELQHSADRVIMSRYAPPGIVVNHRLEILLSRGAMSPYVESFPITPGSPLLKTLKSPIGQRIQEGLSRSITQDVAVRVDHLQVDTGFQTNLFSVEIFPIQVFTWKENCHLLVFVEEPSPQNDVVVDDADPDSLVVQLRDDLNATKVYLHSLIEERDLTNQELVSSNEEAQSSNEELQSTNEELETTKEELQSANEELLTVNEELQRRNSILSDATNDLTNLLNSVSIPVLMLNNELQIRQFTPLAQKLLSVRDTDIGRPIQEIRLNFSINNLEAMLREVLDNLITQEVEVQDRDGRWHILRIRPYRTTDNKIQGVVMVLLDIDQLRRSQIEFRAARDFARDVIEMVQVPLVILDSRFNIRSANRAFRILTDLTNAELQGRHFPDLTLALWGLHSGADVLEKVGSPVQGGGQFETEFEVAGGQSILCIQARAVQSEGSLVYLLTLEDITERKRLERVLARENQRLAGQVRSASLELGQTKEELRALTARLFTTQEEERQRVARELHDDVGQQLALVQLDIEQVQARLSQNPESLDRQLKALVSRVVRLSDEVRHLSHRLHPAILDDLGLAFALKSLVEEFGERESMPANFTRTNVPDRLPKSVSAALYRITQESLRNVAKHAGTTHVRVLLEGSDEGVSLTVADMGEGFDQDSRGAGLGLLSMAERANLVGGTFQIRSQLGRGTTATVHVPLKEVLLPNDEADPAPG